MGQKAFNFPDQIGTGGDSIFQTGTITEHEVQDKDIYIMYSDGVSDNIPINADNFKSCVARYLDQDGVIASKSSVAECIAIQAYHLGKDPNHEGPFFQGALAVGWDRGNLTGGKHDDITVTVGQLFVDQAGQERRNDKDFYRKEDYLYKGTTQVSKVAPSYVQKFIKEDTEDIIQDL